MPCLFFGMGVLEIPSWLDNLLFDKLGARYAPVRSDLTAIDWGTEELKCYLGTYFPRSYTESYGLFRRIFSSNTDFQNKTSLSIYDFASGTGGEIIGFLRAVEECLPNMREVKVSALDGNGNALRILEAIVEAYKPQLSYDLILKPCLLEIEDIYDLSLLEAVVRESYDIVLTSKAICEFISKDRLKAKAAYSEFLRVFKSKIEPKGVILLIDVASPVDDCKYWLGDLMDEAIRSQSCKVLLQCVTRNEEFMTRHRGKSIDRSKIVWRLVR